MEPGHFAERHFAERHFAEGHFAERTFCRTDSLPKGQLAENRDQRCRLFRQNVCDCDSFLN